MNPYSQMKYCLCASILSWFFAQNHFIRPIVELDGAIWDMYDLKGALSSNFRIQTTTLLPQTHFCRKAELGNSFIHIIAKFLKKAPNSFDILILQKFN